MPTIQQVADPLVYGLAGWLQQVASQGLHEEVGEDAAKMCAVQILHAQQFFLVETSAQPTNWDDKKRIDIALKGRSADARKWYGAIEMKWFVEAMDPHPRRLELIQDLFRLGLVETVAPNAKLAVVGGTVTGLAKLFDTPHPEAQDRENRRTELGRLLQRTTIGQSSSLNMSSLARHFPNYADRTPKTLVQGRDRGVNARLLSKADVYIGSSLCGSVFAWQCTKTPGRRQTP